MLSQASTQQVTAHDQFALLSGLAQNDELREELTRNPVETLGRFGIRLAEMPSDVTLPSKEDLALHLGAMKNDQGDPGTPPWVGVHI